MRLIFTHLLSSFLIITLVIVIGHQFEMNAKETSVFELAQIALLLICLIITGLKIYNDFRVSKNTPYRLIIFMASFVTIFILGRETSWGSSYDIIPDHISDIIEYIGLTAVILGTGISAYRLLSMKWITGDLIKKTAKTDMFQYGILFGIFMMIAMGFDKHHFSLGHDEMIEEIFELAGYCYYILSIQNLCQNPTVFLKTD